jgi:hypothetical protein
MGKAERSKWAGAHESKREPNEFQSTQMMKRFAFVRGTVAVAMAVNRPEMFLGDRCDESKREQDRESRLLEMTVRR